MLKRALQFVVPAVFFAALACSDRPAIDPYISDTTEALVSPTPDGMSISNPHRVASLSKNLGVSAAVLAADDSVVFVSVEPGTFPTATGVYIRNMTTQYVVHATIVSGGFDPVAIQGDADDVLELTLERIEEPHVIYVKVPPRKPPNIVRTLPGKGRVDVALNTQIEIIFSEPVDPKTVTSPSIRLTRGSFQVPGQMVIGANGWSVEFHPTEGLLGGTPYEIAISSDVRDGDGDRLDTNYTIDFRTTGCPGYAIPMSCPPIPTGGGSVVSGVVTAWTPDGLKPVAGALVYGWVQTASFGYATGAVRTDDEGRFQHPNLPNQKLQLAVFKAGYAQPCAMLIDVTGDNEPVDLQIVLTSNPMEQATTRRPRISGIIYEVVDGVRVPVSGASVYFDAMDDLIAATNISATDGAYALCHLHNLGFGQSIYAWKQGYSIAYTHIDLLPNDDIKFDIELKRGN